MVELFHEPKANCHIQPPSDRPSRQQSCLISEEEIPNL